MFAKTTCFYVFLMKLRADATQLLTKAIFCPDLPN